MPIGPNGQPLPYGPPGMPGMPPGMPPQGMPPMPGGMPMGGPPMGGGAPPMPPGMAQTPPGAPPGAGPMAALAAGQSSPIQQAGEEAITQLLQMATSNPQLLMGLSLAGAAREISQLTGMSRRRQGGVGQKGGAMPSASGMLAGNTGDLDRLAALQQMMGGPAPGAGGPPMPGGPPGMPPGGPMIPPHFSGLV